MHSLRKPFGIALCLALPWGCAESNDHADAHRSEFAARTITAYALRLRPGEDLRDALEQFCTQHHLRAGAIVTAVGSLSRASIRFADRPDATDLDGPFEIVSLVGTLGEHGMHLHLAIADGDGNSYGGHLARGCIVYTTAELVVAELDGLSFERELDAKTGYRELRIRHAR